MKTALLFLMLFPLIVAGIMLLFKQDSVRRVVVPLTAVILSLGSIYLLVSYLPSNVVYFQAHAEWVNYLMLAIEAVLAVYVIYTGIIHKKYYVSLLMLAQAGLMIYFDIVYGHQIHVENNVFLDHLSVVMALIIGIIGGLICIYAIGYMRDYHKGHKEVKDRRPFFFFVMFVFLSAMFGIVFSNNLLWVYFFWEITTFCSYLLIGYSKSQEAIDNSFRALWMNLLGGFGFAAAIVYAYFGVGTIELDHLTGMDSAAVVIVAMLISFAGITKSAQMPFSKWLLGAMVAPTPTSALLHSSTMVKAGVYILIRFAPVLENTFVGLMVSLVGGLTFLLGSFIAISQSNAKKVLAYSTIANLGLIVACAGVGTYEAIWAAVLLVIFHAIAKSLMFLGVGTVELSINSKNIEDMDGLIRIMPRVTTFLIVGIAGMFLAPFGMLISKWAALQAFVDANFVLVACLAFGSAATVFFWTKWMGKLLTRGSSATGLEEGINRSEWISLSALAILTVLVCALFPLISYFMVEPFVINLYGQTARMSLGNEIIMATMLGMILLLPLELLLKPRDVKYTQPYLCAANINNQRAKFIGAMGATKSLVLKNYYMEEYFSEEKLFKPGAICCILLILIMFGVGII